MLISPKKQKIDLKTDNVFLEILNNRLNGITSEMGHIIHKASFTPFIKEAWDFGQALVSLEGEIFSYPRDVGVAFIVASLMDDAVKAFDDYKPGDIVVMNDPYTTGALCTHLPDFHLLKPYFYKGEMICFTWTFIHSSDVGGLVPGSIAPAAYDIFQEGLRLPPLKLYRAGELNEDVMTIILANSRIPYHNKGDLQALVAAMNVAERRLDDTIEKYGLERFRDGAADLLNYGELRARDIIPVNLPRGSYESHRLSRDGYNRRAAEPYQAAYGGEGRRDPARLQRHLSPGESVAQPADLRKNHHFINAGVLNFIHAVDKSIPLNRGIVRPVSVKIPSGSVLNPEPLRSVGIRFVAAVRVMEMIFGALSLATDGDKPVPDEVGHRAPASGSGTPGVALLAMTTRVPINSRSTSCSRSGWQRRLPVKDGLDGADLPAGFLRNIPAETSEAEMPILVHKFKLSTDDPAALGMWRGGYGIDMEFQVFTLNAMLTTRVWSAA